MKSGLGIVISLILFAKQATCQSILFNKVYDDNTNYNHSLATLVDASSQSYILFGSAFDQNSYFALNITKISANGDIIWQNDYDLTAGADLPASAVMSYQGKYIVCGSTKDSLGIYTDAFIAEFDTNGTLNWWKRYGGLGNQSAEFITTSFGHGYIISGYTTSDSTNTRNPYYFCIDEFGNIIWEKKIYQLFESPLYCVAKSIDSNYFFCGEVDSPSVLSYKIRLLKTDTSGNILWDKKFGSVNPLWARRIKVASDSTLLVAGSIEISGNIDAYLMKTDLSGNIIWSRSWGDVTNFDAVQDFDEIDGEIIEIIGTQNNYYEVVCLMYNLQGDTIRSFRLRNDTTISPYIEHYLYDLECVNSNLFAASGQRINNNSPTKNDAWLVVFDSLGCDNAACNFSGIEDGVPLDPEKFRFYPIPATNELHISFLPTKASYEFMLVDILGRQVISKSFVNKQIGEITINTENIPNGTFVGTIKSQNGLIYKSKIIILH